MGISKGSPNIHKLEPDDLDTESADSTSTNDTKNISSWVNPETITTTNSQDDYPFGIYDDFSFLDDETCHFFNDAFFDAQQHLDGFPSNSNGEAVSRCSDMIPDVAIDPLLENFTEPSVLESQPLARYFSPVSTPLTLSLHINPKLPDGVSINKTQSSESSLEAIQELARVSSLGSYQEITTNHFAYKRPSKKSTQRISRRSKKEESTYDLGREARFPVGDKRLHPVAQVQSKAYACPTPPLSQNCVRYSPSKSQITAAPGLVYLPLDPAASTTNVDDFLAAVSPSFLNPDISDKVEVDNSEKRPDLGERTPSQPRVIGQKDFTFHMLAPSITPVQPVEKRKRGRPKKDEKEEQQQTQPSVYQIQPMIPFHSALRRTSALQQAFPPQGHFLPPHVSVNHGSHQNGLSEVYRETMAKPKIANKDESEIFHPAKRRKRTTNGAYRSMSKKEQAYLEMDKKVKLYDETNIHELLCYPELKPGRMPCYWIQRHPYANTRIYADHYRTWCRYRECKGVETCEKIRTAGGEWKEKNYKHPRTIIAGNYQVAVDWEYVDDEIVVFKENGGAQHEYDRRNVFDTVECFFHLRCFEKLVNFPQFVREQIVKVDHRVLNKDKSRNKITKRKNKGGTNATEIEWYLKDHAEAWMERVRLDLDFNPEAGSEFSLERVLLDGKKSHNEKKGMGKYTSGTTSPVTSHLDLPFP